MTLSVHPYADLFPLIEGQEFYDFAEDIRLTGLADRIDLLDGAILDGRNRYRALVWIMSTGEALGDGWGAVDLHGKPLPLAQLDPATSHLFKRFDPETDGDPLDYVLSKNFRRRHLTDDQRRMVGAKLVTLKQGRPAECSQIANISRDQAAKLTQSDVAGIDRARAVIAHAAPEISQAVEQGRVSVAAAAEIAAQPAQRQAAIVASLPRDAEGRLTPETKKALAPVIREIRKEKIEAKRERRAEREAQQGRKIQALPDRYGIAIEDFEWDHEAWSRETGTERHPSMHYETAEDAHTPEEIAARCAERFACLADDCILFKWTTGPHLAIAIKVMELQGFRYVTNLVWNKLRSGNARGPGYWFTGEHEIVLVGVRGKVVPPATAHFRSTFSAPVGAHSEKPDNLHEIIELHWPNTPKVEFNARRARPGWAVWGNQAPAAQVRPIAAEALPLPPKPPASRPRAEALADGLDIPAFLRRTAQPSGVKA
ncbi:MULTISPECIES: MT-A70 family methyltransferase [unclassified Bradyrhizobium]|uniref:MT-A70 family methyltransferase n=1 Tax=unclassified Bradyrhizobium TaxID=2631580 RepID=UPI0028ED10A3|nr:MULTISPECIES: MT-A70 family methyltransferase [unclassified Bradyrhizobium]